jgi:quinohemoprotein ethanol dehydrogenase
MCDHDAMRGVTKITWLRKKLRDSVDPSYAANFGLSQQSKWALLMNVLAIRQCAFKLSSKKALRGVFNQAVFLAIALNIIAAPAETTVDTGAIADAQQGGNWLSVGRTYSEDRYSPLDHINDRNIKQVGLAWYLDLPNQGPLQATPLAVDGVLYFTGMMGWVYATDGRTGRLLWEYDPDLAHHVMDHRSVIWNGNRGIAFWKGKVYVGAVDGRLIALDAKAGHLLWSVQTFDEGNTLKTISGAPRVFDGKVIIGHGGESGTRGYVMTYDAETGRKL